MLQAYAWAGMLVNYAKTDGVARAVVDTFSGERPCELCCRIAKEKTEAAKQGGSKQTPELASVSKLRFEFFAPATTMLAAPAASDLAATVFVRPLIHECLGGMAPPVPPPREWV